MRIDHTLESITAEALKYNTRSDFKKGSKNVYQAALRRGFIDEVCAHMEPVGNGNPRFVYAYVFKNKVYVGLTDTPHRRDLYHKSQVSNKKLGRLLDSKAPYSFIRIEEPVLEKDAPELERKWISYFESLDYTMLNLYKGGSLGNKTFIWTKEAITAEALRYKTRSEFQRCSVSAYNAARRLRILDEVCKHMTAVLKTHTLQSITAEAFRYKTRLEFQRCSKSAYNAARRLGILDEVCKHMPKRAKRKPKVLAA